ncbi:hypothetical protein NEMBOFW57_003082 [Staphylotrichum longicolle]|uniref:Sodium/calcium exchanger membrane region domain-containing protein n=1 Tax=Staphylotrichum longicolle TaxID=669026 RepID=A0AAD4F4J5_9PEZI|nr:hypothetical protein NEMBOFW57_003082 [Staphylotrichum longicolle]
MPTSRATLRQRRRFSARPVVAGALLVALIAAFALLQSTPAIGGRRYLSPRALQDTDADCRNVHHAADQCAFVLANCEDDEAGLIHYLSFYYCALGRARFVAFAILALWLGLLFTTIGIAASDFFSVNLSTIASVLGLSESLAGVTFLAFGNGSPDVFSTFAAMGSNSGSMAVGELIGAAGFITAVVAGSMALVREFKVSKRTFVRDIVFFIAAISFTMVFLADGELHLWECFTMIGFYVFYVAVVVGWHWFTTRRRKQRARDAASRAHFYVHRVVAPKKPADISILERGPRIEVDGVPPTEDDDEDREIHVAAEMASSMRVNRPRWGRSNTTITPIRPSLVGALEFRSVLSSLQKERNMHLGPLHSRSNSTHQPATAGFEDVRGRPSESRHHSFPGFDEPEEQPRPVKWGPYQLLPAPHVLLGTFFPTLQAWKEKSLWDKVVSLISVPSIFLLVATLPVVENEHEDDESEDDLADPPQAGQPGNTATAVSIEPSGEIQPETEWQAYRRRRARSNASRSPISQSPSLLSLGTPHLQPLGQQQQQPPPISIPGPSLPKPAAPDSEHTIATTTTTTPPAAGWNRWLVAIQLFTGPLFVVLILWANTADDMAHPRKTLVKMILYALLASLCLLAALLLTTTAVKKPRYHFLLCFLGFVISVAWISTIAGEVVGVLKAFGVILDISEAILGLTVFAVGNSLGDLVADVTVARLGYPVMALAACFGGPMLNILLGVGIGGAWMGMRSAEKKQRKHPGAAPKYKPYRIQVGGTLMISAVTVLLTLIVLLIVVPGNQWVMSRRIGWGLIGIWTVGTVVNLVVELTGTWADTS